MRIQKEKLRLFWRMGHFREGKWSVRAHLQEDMPKNHSRGKGASADPLLWASLEHARW